MLKSTTIRHASIPDRQDRAVADLLNDSQHPLDSMLNFSICGGRQRPLQDPETHPEQTASPGVERESELQTPVERLFPAKPARTPSSRDRRWTLPANCVCRGMVPSRLAKKARSGRSSTEYGVTGEIVPKAAITVSRAGDLSQRLLNGVFIDKGFHGQRRGLLFWWNQRTSKLPHASGGCGCVYSAGVVAYSAWPGKLGPDRCSRLSSHIRRCSSWL